MDIKVLKNFVTIAEAGSILGAAKLLHVSQPPLTKQVQALEEELGVPLFHRSVHGVELTEYGKLLYNKATALISYSDSILLDMKSAGTKTLQIGMVSSAAEYSLQLLSACSGELDLSYHITEETSFELLSMVDQGLLDAAFIRCPFETKAGLETLKVSDDTLVAAGVPSLFDTSQETITLTELYRLPLAAARRWAKHLEKYSPDDLSPPEFRLLCDDTRTSISAAASGLGAAVVPASAVRGLETKLTVKTIELDANAADLFMVYRPDRRDTAVKTQFINFMKQNIPASSVL